MRVLKCFLANDREGHFVTAIEAMSAPGQVWSCASCGCRLVLHAGTFSDPACFEHDTQTVARDVLMNCAHLDQEVKAEARHWKLSNPSLMDSVLQEMYAIIREALCKVTDADNNVASMLSFIVSRSAWFYE